MTPFNINDRVRVIASPCRWHNLVGIIHDEAAGQYHVRGLDAAPVWFYPYELVHVAPVEVDG